MDIMNVKFYELAIGARFSFRGQDFEKTAMSMAEDERHWGNIFRPEIEVISDGPFLPADVAAMWKPSEVHWTHFLKPAPGQEIGLEKSESGKRKAEIMLDKVGKDKVGKDKEGKDKD